MTSWYLKPRWTNKVDVNFDKNNKYININYWFSGLCLTETEGLKDEKGPNMKAIIGGVGGGILCSILFVTFACCCLSPNRSPCRRGPQQRTVSPADTPQASRHRPVRRDGHRRNPSSVSTISTSMFTPHLNRGGPSMAHPEEIPLELRPPPYTSAPPPPLEIEVIPSSASNSSSSPPPPYAEQDPHPNCVRSDSVPSYHSRWWTTWN